MRRTTELVRNTMLFSLSAFSTKLSGFFILPFLTRHLSTMDYGLWDLMSFTIAFLFPLLTVTTSEGIIKFLVNKDYQYEVPITFGINILFVALTLSLALYPLFIRIFEDKIVVNYFYGLFALRGLSQMLSSFARGINKVREQTIAGITQSVILLFGTFILVGLFGLGLEGVLFSSMIAFAVGSAYLIKSLNIHRLYKPRSLTIVETRSIFLYCLPFTPTRLSWWLTNYSNRFIIKGFLGIDSLGLFAAASRIPSLITVFQGLFIQAWELSALKEYDKEDGQKYFTKVYSGYTSIMIVMASLLICLVEPIGNALLGSTYIGGLVVVPFLIVSIVFGSLVGFLNTINMADSSTKYLIMPVIIGGILTLGLNFVLVPKFGLVSAGIVSIFSNMTIWVLRLRNTQKIMYIDINYTRIILCYTLLILESFIAINVLREGLIWMNYAIFIILFFVNRKEFLLVLKSFTFLIRNWKING